MVQRWNQRFLILSIGVLLICTPQISFAFSFSDQPTSFISFSQADGVTLIQWTQSKKELLGQLQGFWIDKKTFRGESANFSFTGIRNNSNLSLTLNDGQIITGSINGNNLTLGFPLKDGTIAQIEFKPGTIEEYNQLVADLTSKKNLTLVYQQFVSLLKDAKSRLKILPNLDTTHKGGLEENYRKLLAKMESDYQKGNQAVQMTYNCVQRGIVKANVLSVIDNDYSWAITAQSNFRSNIEYVFESNIKNVKGDIAKASQDLVAIKAYGKEKNPNISSTQIDNLSKYFKGFSNMADGQVKDAISKFNGVQEEIAKHNQKARIIYDKSQKVFMSSTGC